jgi:hypothetical protein
MERKGIRIRKQVGRITNNAQNWVRTPDRIDIK